MFVDADAHVIECADTWSYFPSSMSDVRPAEMSFDEGQTPPFLEKRPSRGVFIDGQIFRHILRNDGTTGTTSDTREMRDVPGRLKHMDEQGVESQILYPTTLLTEVTRRPEVEVAICESYNRWLADRCGESGGRLKWNAILPVHSMPDVLKEMKRVKEAGASGIFRRGFECDERRASDPYFFPLYDLAQDLDLSICFHIAHPYTGHHNAMTKTQLGMFSSSYTIDAFLALLMDGVAKRYKSLRFGFVEAAAGWLPYALWLAGFDALYSNQRSDKAAASGAFSEVLEEAGFYVTCESTEDLPYLVSQVGENALCLGTDYGHSDRAAIRGAHTIITERDDLGASAKEAMTSLNARNLYALSAS